MHVRILSSGILSGRHTAEGEPNLFFGGNRWVGWRQYVPYTKAQLKEMIEVSKFYAFIRPTPVSKIGHNAMAAFSYIGIYSLVLVEIVTGGERQTRGTFVYGGGANFDITSNFGLRAEYRGLVYKVPDFNVSALNLDKFTHLAQPSFGFYFRF